MLKTSWVLLRLLLKENGVVWTFCCGVYSILHYGLRLNAHTLDRLMRQLEYRWNLPGMGSININYAIWQNWNWNSYGHEWTDSEEWKQALLNDILFNYVGLQKDILEVGPGGGRWTEILQKRARHLTLVDLSDRCIEVCKQRFCDCENMTFVVNHGMDLPGIADGTIDVIWAFDVFVHITPADTVAYMEEFARVLRSGGRVIIHHAKDAGGYGAWRSRLTDALFADIVQSHGFNILAQIDSIGQDRLIPISPHQDTLTIFTKP